ncbi:MAG TPA: response regulator transcription factor [Segetibacter sp.]|jgi:DNA-binding response OmpR family regulator
MNNRILLIEDDSKLSLIIKETLQLYNLEVFIATDGVEGVKAFSELKPDLVVADIMMPRMDGFEALSHIRALDKKVPVIILTSKSQTVDLVKGFDLGCNDYIRKPFIMDELLVRIRALLTSTQLQNKDGDERDVIKIGQYVFHVNAHELRSPSQVYELSYKETEILKRLCIHPNRVLDRKSILLELWGDDNLFNSKNLNVYITRIRNYFKDDKYIQIINLRNIGYKLVLKT